MSYNSLDELNLGWVGMGWGSILNLCLVLVFVRSIGYSSSKVKPHPNIYVGF